MSETIRRLLELADTQLFSIRDTPITVATLATVLVVVVATYVGSWAIRRAVEAGFRRRKIQAPGTVAAISRLIHYLVLFVGLGIALQTAGIDLATLFAAGAVFAVGLGFAMQTIAQNFVSGVILLIERAIKPGDVLAVEDRIVRVQEMGIRSTIVSSRDGEELIVPNSVVVQGTVINYTLRDSAYRVRVRVGVSYGSDMKQVRRTLEGVAKDITERWGQAEREAQVNLMQFGDGSVVWEVAAWMNDPWLERRALSELHEAIWSALKEDDIVIAFPQLDVHFDAPLDTAIGRLAAAS